MHNPLTEKQHFLKNQSVDNVNLMCIVLLCVNLAYFGGSQGGVKVQSDTAAYKQLADYIDSYYNPYKDIGVDNVRVDGGAYVICSCIRIHQ